MPLDKDRMDGWLLAQYTKKMFRNIDDTNLSDPVKESFKTLIKEVPQEFKVDVYDLAMVIGMPKVFGERGEVVE